MSIKIMSWVWEHSKQKGSNRLVLLALADNANDAGECWPSIPTIAHKCLLSERYVQLIIREIIADYELESIPGMRYGKSSNIYRLLTTGIQGRLSSPRGEEALTPTTPRGEEALTPGVRKPSPKPSLNHHLNEPNENEPSLKAPPPPADKAMTSGQLFFLHSFNAKRFANSIQSQAVAELESQYPEHFEAGIEWAATAGMAMGRAIQALKKALPKWGQPKSPIVSGNNDRDYEPAHLLEGV